MKTYPNQKTFTIHKHPLATADVFLQLNLRVLNIAIQNLSPAALAVYLNMAANKDGFPYVFSPSILEKTTGYSERTLRRARQELEEKGYIEGNNFFVLPPQDRERLKEISETFNS